MMMDLVLYAVPVTDDININKKDKWINLIQTMNGRFIWDYFKRLDNTVMIRNDQTLTIPKEAWEGFIDILDRNRDIIHNFIYYKDAGIEEVDYYHKKLFYNLYQSVFNTTSFKYYYKSKAITMEVWLEADSEVRKYLDDPSYTIILEARY